MTNNKMTIREGFEKARAMYENMGDKQMVEFFDGRLAQLVKKNLTERKPTPKQVENEGFKSDILAWMENGKSYSIADITKGVPSVIASGISSNRVTALMTQLREAQSVVRTEVKGKAFYSLA